MDLANPAGLWALLGLPAVLAIHFLQRRARVIPVTTLFLLERTRRESASGRTFERLLPSIPLGLQLLAVLLLAWLLAAPRFPREQSVQRVAVVLDSSASMSVFREPLEQRLATALPRLQGGAERLELTILDGDGRPLRRADSPGDALAALDDWQPRGGLVDPGPALRIARSLVGGEGIVLWASDTPLEPVPHDGRLLAVGEAIANVGATGPRVDAATRDWRVIVRNYGPSRSSRSWHLAFPDGSTSEPVVLTLDGGALATLDGRLPEDVDRAELVLEPDRFPLDDRVPLILPRPRVLRLHASGPPAMSELAERLASSLEAVEPGGADLTLAALAPGDPFPEDGDAILFDDRPDPAARHLEGEVVAERHPLVDDLNWQALQVRADPAAAPHPDEQVLLRQGSRPLLVLREPDGGPRRQLRFLFDLEQSNALRLPAFIVCLHRFVESVRAERVAEARENLETGQALELAAHAGGPTLVVTRRTIGGETLDTQSLPAAARVRLETPREPGFLEVRQGEETLLTAALHFADSREADFSSCATLDSLAGASRSARERHHVDDPWWRVWLLLLLTALLLSWALLAAPRDPHPVPSP